MAGGSACSSSKGPPGARRMMTKESVMIASSVGTSMATRRIAYANIFVYALSRRPGRQQSQPTRAAVYRQHRFRVARLPRPAVRESCPAVRERHSAIREQLASNCRGAVYYCYAAAARLSHFHPVDGPGIDKFLDCRGP